MIRWAWMQRVTDSDDPFHLPNHDLIIDTLLPLGIVQTCHDGQVAKGASILALLIGNNLCHPCSTLVDPSLYPTLEPGRRREHHPPGFAPFLRQPLDQIRCEEFGLFDRMKGTEAFRFFVFVESGVLVFPVRVGPFGGWGPLRWGRVRVVRLFGFGFGFEFEFGEEVDSWCHSGSECGDWRRTAMP